MKEQGIDETRFRAIRNGLYGSLVMETDHAYNMANRMVGNYLNGAETFDAIEALQRITPADILARAEKMFAEERSCLSVIKPKEE